MRRALGAALLALALLAGCQPDPDAPPLFRDTQEYRDAIVRVQELTKGPIEALRQGQAVSPQDKKGLEEAKKLIDGMIAFKADNYGTYVLKGMTLRALGKDDEAVTAFLQGLALAPKQLAPDDVQAVARLHEEMARIYLQRGEAIEAEKHAEEYLRLLPEEPVLLAEAAGVKVQLKKTKEARELIEKALRLQPGNKRAIDLKKLIEMAEKG